MTRECTRKHQRERQARERERTRTYQPLRRKEMNNVSFSDSRKSVKCHLLSCFLHYHHINIQEEGERKSIKVVDTPTTGKGTTTESESKTHMIPRPLLPRQSNLRRQLLMSIQSLRSTTEKGHDIVDISIIDFDGHVTRM